MRSHAVSSLALLRTTGKPVATLAITLGGEDWCNAAAPAKKRGAERLPARSAGQNLRVSSLEKNACTACLARAGAERGLGERESSMSASARESCTCWARRYGAVRATGGDSVGQRPCAKDSTGIFFRPWSRVRPFEEPWENAPPARADKSRKRICPLWKGSGMQRLHRLAARALK